MARRLVLGFVVIFERHFIFQLILFSCSIIVQVTFYSYVKPYDEPLFQKQQVFNEVFLMFVLYNTFSLTDFVPEPETRYQIGFALITFVTGDIVINLALLTISSAKLAINTMRKHLRKKRYNKKVRQLQEDRRADELNEKKFRKRHQTALKIERLQHLEEVKEASNSADEQSRHAVSLVSFAASESQLEDFSVDKD